MAVEKAGVRDELERRIRHLKFLGYDLFDIEQLKIKDMESALHKLDIFTQKISELDKLKLKIPVIDDNGLEKIGKTVESYLTGEFRGIDSYATSVWKSVELEKARRNVVRQGNMDVCIHCHGLIAKNLIYCPKCGKKLTPDPVISTDAEPDAPLSASSSPHPGEVMYACPVCDSTIPENAATCPRCGAVFEDESGSEVVSPFASGKDSDRPHAAKKKPQRICPLCRTQLSHTNKEYHCLSCGRKYCGNCPGNHVPPANRKITITALYTLRQDSNSSPSPDADGAEKIGEPSASAGSVSKRFTMTEVMPFQLCSVCYAEWVEKTRQKLIMRLAEWERKNIEASRLLGRSVEFS